MKDGSENETKLIFSELENGFKMLADGDKRWEDLLKETEKAVESYNYLYNQLDKVKRFQEDAEIQNEFPKLKEMLICKIFSKISEEITLLERSRNECEKIVENLREKQKKVASLLARLESSCFAATRALLCLEEAVDVMARSCLKMTTSMYDAKALKCQISKASFAYPPSQKQMVECTLFKWKFYASQQ